MKYFGILLILLFLGTLQAEELLVYEGTEGPGKGKHIVFIASDHEYRGEETCPAIARIMAKKYGFKCSVLFGLDDNGHLQPGSSKIPGMKVLEKADLMFIFARFLDPDDESMKYFDDYIKAGKPVLGLRTSTHAFQMKGNAKYKKYHFRSKEEGWKGGFGRQVLGETWAGHYGKNHVCSTRIIPKDDQKSHPVMAGVGQMHIQAGGYKAAPEPNSVIIADSIVLKTMKKDSAPLEGKVPQPGIWVRTYKGESGNEGRVFASTYGASEDILDDSYRRCIINGVFWTMGMEDKIKADMDVDFVGPYNPVTFSFGGYRKEVKPLDIKGWDTPIWNPEASTAKPGKKKK